MNVKEFLVNGSTQDARQVQWEKVFNTCFLKVDDEVSGKVSRVIIPVEEDANVSNSEPVAPETVGSTAVVAVVCSSHIIVANCGDSRAVLYRGKEPVPLSVDHKVSSVLIIYVCLSFSWPILAINRFDSVFQPNRDDEYARIEASGGKVIQWNGHRVFGVLAMSRSIGRSINRCYFCRLTYYGFHTCAHECCITSSIYALHARAYKSRVMSRFSC